MWYHFSMKNYLTSPYIIRVGLACVFLANSLMAFFQPGEFQDLVSSSFVSGLLPVSVPTFVTFIGFNDLTVAVLFLLGWQTSRVAMYATLWIIGVIVTVGVFTLDALEHFGFIAMTLTLAVQERMRR